MGIASLRMAFDHKQTEATAPEMGSSIFVFDYNQMSSEYGFDAFKVIKAGLDGSHGVCAFLDGDLDVAAGGPSGVPRLLMEMRDDGRLIEASRADSPLARLAELDHLHGYVAAMWTDNAQTINLLNRHLTSRFRDAYLGCLTHAGQVDLTRFHNIFRPLQLPVRATYVDGQERPAAD